MTRTLFLGILLLFFYGCHNTPTPPSDDGNGTGPPEPVLYVGNWGGNEVYVVNTDSNAVVDTIQGFPDWVWNLAVTPGGTTLYVSTREGALKGTGRVFAVEPRTHERELLLAEEGDVYVAPSGKVLIISKGRIGTIDTISNTITFFGSLDIRATGREHYQTVAFAHHAPLLYGVNHDLQLFAYDYATQETKCVFQHIYDPYHFIISPDDQLLYIAGGVVFSLKQDSIIACIPSYFLGSLAMSPNGEYLYITDPGNMQEDVPSGKISIFQTSTYHLVGYIDVSEVTGHFATPTDHIVMTPDSETAYVSTGLTMIFVVDLATRRVTTTIEVSPNSVAALPLVLGYR